jgi:hypothetical protein
VSIEDEPEKRSLTRSSGNPIGCASKSGPKNDFSPARQATHWVSIEDDREKDLF